MTCKHDHIQTYRIEDGTPVMWACAECKHKFEPLVLPAADAKAGDEPVAWLHKGGHVQVRAPYLSAEAIQGYSTNGQWTPLFTRPQPQADAVRVPHKHEWFSTGAMEPGQMRCISCGVWGSDCPQPQADAVRVPEGWKLVPVELTDDMHNAFDHIRDREGLIGIGPGEFWDSMLAAAPKPEDKTCCNQYECGCPR